MKQEVGKLREEGHVWSEYYRLNREESACLEVGTASHSKHKISWHIKGTVGSWKWLELKVLGKRR